MRLWNVDIAAIIYEPRLDVEVEPLPPILHPGSVGNSLQANAHPLAVSPDGKIYISDGPGLRVLTPVQ